ncbi:MAG TPA: aldo/keto reductase [Solirubrobacteraceae bacterium]|jgi:2,5-diketo-D-gluconate reductase B|nr:aldo/keto reductase [Solirubrobacteraceae bacterium]
MSNGDEAVEIQGTRVPVLGFGTWLITGPDATEAVRDALEIGYRQIDTARAYENEREVGRGIADSGVPRDEIFLTTKVPHDEASAGEVERDCEQSLERLGVDHLDLLLLHWPSPDVPLEETLKALTALRDDGRIRNLGVSNFPAGLLAQALELAPVFCDQVEYHPFLDQGRLLDLARANDVLITAYSPLAHGKVPGDATLSRIGSAHGKTAGQVALRWLLDQDHVSPIPKASSHERRLENFEVFDFELSADERAEIDALPKDARTADPPWAPDWDA